MKDFLKLAILAVAAYFAYDYFVAQGHWKDWRLPAAKQAEKPPPDAKPEDFQRHPGRGLNPFTTEDMPGSSGGRPPMPKIPGQ